MAKKYETRLIVEIDTAEPIEQLTLRALLDALFAAPVSVVPDARVTAVHVYESEKVSDE